MTDVELKLPCSNIYGDIRELKLSSTVYRDLFVCCVTHLLSVVTHRIKVTRDDCHLLSFPFNAVVSSHPLAVCALFYLIFFLFSISRISSFSSHSLLAHPLMHLHPRHSRSILF